MKSELCMFKNLCKNYYSYLDLGVITFLTKIQNWCYKTNKKLVTLMSSVRTQHVSVDMKKSKPTISVTL